MSQPKIYKVQLELTNETGVGSNGTEVHLDLEAVVTYPGPSSSTVSVHAVRRVTRYLGTNMVGGEVVPAVGVKDCLAWLKKNFTRETRQEIYEQIRKQEPRPAGTGLRAELVKIGAREDRDPPIGRPGPDKVKPSTAPAAGGGALKKAGGERIKDLVQYGQASKPGDFGGGS